MTPTNPHDLVQERPGAWFLQDSWRHACGLPSKPEPNLKGKTLEQLWQSEWNARFEHLMRGRLVMGALRYGLLGHPGKPKFDLTARMIKELKRYQETGDLEALVDTANFCLLEFTETTHPLAHFGSNDDHGHQDKTRIIK